MTPAPLPALEVVRPGPLTTVQDLGRPGRAALGVGASGAVDRGALRLANRLLGNPERAAGLELTFGGLEVRARGDLLVALTGARGMLETGPGTRGAAADRAAVLAAYDSAFPLPDGAVLRVLAPTAGLRTYLGVRGGIAVAPVLGSRSTDLLAGIGPARLADGDLLPVGPAPAEPPAAVEVAPVAAPATGDVRLQVVLGPRDDWFSAEAVRRLLTEPYEVSPESNRVGIRLDGPALERARDGELPSEGVVPGAVQVPTGGRPVLFLADAPVTGGYPVVAVVVRADLDRAGQARPGQRLRFRPVPGGPR